MPYAARMKKESVQALKRNERPKGSKRSRPRRGSPQAILRHVGTWQGDPAEVDQLVAELRRMKEAEVAAKMRLLAKQPKRRAGNGKAAALSQRTRRP